MPRKLEMRLGGKKWHRSVVHSTQEFWNTKSFIATGKERYPLGNAYFLDSQGFRQYCVKFQRGLTVYIDPERTKSNHTQSTETLRSGKYLLERFYSLKLKPLAFKWYKAKHSLETSHWICIYPAHYLVIVELSRDGIHAKNHEATLYYRINGGMIAIACQDYEGHLKGNIEYPQPEILQSELREWRINRAWFQDAFLREALFKIR